METFEYPDFIARFYDIIYHNVRDGVDNRFFLDQASSVKGKVLEIGAGTGRLFTEALKKGVDIYAVDISKSMVAVLKSKIPAKDHCRVMTANVVDMAWDFKFDLIIAPFRMFSHLTEVEEQLKFLQNVHRHLTGRGKFIFDVFVPDPSLLVNGIKDMTDFDAEYEPGKNVKRILNSRPDLINQVLNVSMKLVWDEDNGTIEKEWEFRMRYFFRYELEHLISLSPLRLKVTYGDYQMNPLNAGSKDFIMVCTRR